MPVCQLLMLLLDYYALRCATIPSLCCLFREKEFSMQGAYPGSRLALTTSLALGFVKVSLDGGKKEILSGRKKLNRGVQICLIYRNDIHYHERVPIYW